MKSIKHIHSIASLIIAVLLITIQPSFTEENHLHPHDEVHEHETSKQEPGPNGGRLIEGDDFKLEFLVKEDRKVQISFLNEDGELVSPQDQHITLIGGDRSNPIRLQFENSGSVLLSTGTWPDNNNLPAILSIKASQSAKTVRERFNINMSTCPECSLHEYACICGHEEHGHSHGPDTEHQHK